MNPPRGARPRVLSCIVLTGAFLLAVPAGAAPAEGYSGITWKYLSSKKGDLPAPNGGGEQTSSVVFDVDKDGVNDFVITERTAAPSVVLYRRNKTGWTRSILDKDFVTIEAGSLAIDVDGDGDLDLIGGGDYKSNQVWWWENPNPKFDPATPWKRRVIKSSGKNKHHDQIAGDFDGDGKLDVVFWNQEGHSLMWATAPANPRATDKEWNLATVYTWSDDGQPQQRNHGGEPVWKRPGEHEGFAKADIDGDGKMDIIGGGHWFKVVGPHQVTSHPIDPSYTFTRSAVGQLVEGGRPEVVLSVGDGKGPLMMYEWQKGTWVSKVLLEGVQDGHSVSVADINKDGKLDIFIAEMRIKGGNPGATIRLLLGDGQGNFKTTVVATGHDAHEAKLVDLDGDGDLDILGKPYNFEPPHVEVWLNMGPTKR